MLCPNICAIAFVHMNYFGIKFVIPCVPAVNEYAVIIIIIIIIIIIAVDSIVNIAVVIITIIVT